MHSIRAGWRGRSRCSMVANALLACIVVILSATAAARAEDVPATETRDRDTSSAIAPARPEPGIVVKVEGLAIAPRNLDLDYAFFDESGSLSGGGELRTLSPGREIQPRFSLGYRLRAEGAPTIGVTIWEFDHGFSSETGKKTAMIGALLASPDFAIGRSLVDFGRAEIEIRATLADAGVTWERESGRRTRLGFSAGIRLFRFEQETAVVYGALRSGSTLREFLNMSTDASGIGPRGGASFGYRLGRATISAEVGLAVPVGDLKGEFTDAAFINGSFDRSTVASRPGTRKAFTQFDGALGLDIRITGKLKASISYLYSQWPGVSVNQRFVDDVSQNTTLPIEQDAVFEGFTVGFSYEF